MSTHERVARALRLGAALLLVGLGSVVQTACDDGGTGGQGGGGEGGGKVAPGWQVVFDDGKLDRALLSVWGTSSKSVYAVGGPLGNSGFASLALHYDGKKWKHLDPGGSETFWWVSGSSDTDVWMVGEHGRIAHYDGSGFSESDRPTTATLWGAIAFSPTDAWAVGGSADHAAGEDTDVVAHYDGTSWTRIVLPGAPLGRALFKVWGTSSDDLYVVGEASTIWHKTGDTWALESDPPLGDGTLFTVFGCSADEVYAVGSRSILRRDASGWTKLPITLTNGVNGVTCATASAGAPWGTVAVVGFGGLKKRLVGDSFTDEFASDPHGDLHSVWADETGAFWAVGGDFIAQPSAGKARNGMVTRYGDSRVSTELE